MPKKNDVAKKRKIHEELKAIRQLKDVADVLSTDDIENAFLSSSTGQSEAADESAAEDVLSKVASSRVGIQRLERLERPHASRVSGNGKQKTSISRRDVHSIPKRKPGRSRPANARKSKSIKRKAGK